MGASACLVNTAIAVAGDPVTMAVAFKQAVEAGRMAYEAGLGIQADNFVAEASSPLTAFLNENDKTGRFTIRRFTIEVCIVKQLLISRWVYDCMSNSNRKPSNRKS